MKKSVKECIEFCLENEIKYLSLFAFSPKIGPDLK